MSVAKMIEISAESKTSFEDAVRAGLTQAAKSVDNIRSAWVKDQEVVVDGGNISVFRVHLKVTFVLSS